MATTGNVFVRTGEDNAGIGATAWTNPGSVVSDNTTDATCAAATSSHYLVARNADLSTVPDGAVIDGITIRVEASEHSTGTEVLSARLQDDTATLIGNTKTATISGTAKTVYTYGAANDVWGAALTAAIVKHTNFGVRCWFTTAHDVRIDYITIAVNYHLAVAGTLTLLGVATFVASGTVVTAGGNPVLATLTLTGLSGMTALASRRRGANATLQATAALTALPTRLRSATLTWQGVATITPSANRLRTAVATLRGLATVAGSATARRAARVVLQAEATLILQASGTGAGESAGEHHRATTHAAVGAHGRRMH